MQRARVGGPSGANVAAEAAGARVRELRLEQGLRQADLAEIVSVTQPYIGMLERGEVRHPSRRVRDAIAAALGIDTLGEPTLGLVEAAAYLRVDPATLRSSDIPCEHSGHRYDYARRDLDEARDSHPCAEPGCDRIALGASGGCEAHGQALLQRGLKRPPDVRERIRLAHVATHADPERGPRWRAAISAANRGRRRPDVRERVRAMHADRKQHYTWGLRLVEGRGLPGRSIRKWKNRLNGLEGGRHRLTTDPDYDQVLQEIRDDYARTHDSEADLAERASERHPHFNRGKGVSRRMVRLALGRPI